MDKGARYIVQTRYGYFSLDEGSYRDYLAGKLWINWPPVRTPDQPVNQEASPPDVSNEAIRLRDRAGRQGVLETIQAFAMQPRAPYKERMRDLAIYELNLSARASNGLMRAGAQTFGALDRLIHSEGGLAAVRNLGAKSVKEIQDAFLAECYDRLLAYEKTIFWQEVLDQNEEGTA